MYLRLPHSNLKAHLTCGCNPALNLCRFGLCRVFDWHDRILASALTMKAEDRPRELSSQCLMYEPLEQGTQKAEASLRLLLAGVTVGIEIAYGSTLSYTLRRGVVGPFGLTSYRAFQVCV
jgi:hypothetical protein